MLGIKMRKLDGGSWWSVRFLSDFTDFPDSHLHKVPPLMKRVTLNQLFPRRIALIGNGG